MQSNQMIRLFVQSVFKCLIHIRAGIKKFRKETTFVEENHLPFAFPTQPLSQKRLTSVRCS